MNKSIICKTVFAVGLLSSAAHGMEMTAGQVEYMQACASCHGESGKGDGPVSTYMTKPVPDLTQIRVRNDGEFPFQDLLEMVDGRLSERQPGPHGTAMPVWGERFAFGSSVDDPIEAEINTLGRMTSLIYYLHSLQEE